MPLMLGELTDHLLWPDPGTLFAFNIEHPADNGTTAALSNLLRSGVESSMCAVVLLDVYLWCSCPAPMGPIRKNVRFQPCLFVKSNYKLYGPANARLGYL